MPNLVTQRFIAGSGMNTLCRVRPGGTVDRPQSSLRDDPPWWMASNASDKSLVHSVSGSQVFSAVLSLRKAFCRKHLLRVTRCSGFPGVPNVSLRRARLGKWGELGDRLMKRQTKPYFKKSHRAFYVNLNGKPIRARQRGGRRTRRRWKPISGSWPVRLPPSDDLTVAVLMHRFIASHEHSPPGTRRFYTRPCRSFLDYIGAALRVSEAAPYHVKTWLRECHAFKRLPSGKRSDQPTSSTYRHNLVCAVKSAFCWGERKATSPQTPSAESKAPPQVPRGDEAHPNLGPVGEGRCLRRPEPAGPARRADGSGDQPGLPAPGASACGEPPLRPGGPGRGISSWRNPRGSGTGGPRRCPI